MGKDRRSAWHKDQSNGAARGNCQWRCVAVALTAGECTAKHFTDERLRNTTVKPLMAKTKLEEKPELTRVFREENAWPAAIEVRTARGVFYSEVLYPHGDPRNPMTWADVSKKFKNQAEPVLGAAATEKVISRTRALENETDIAAFAEVLGETPQ